MAYEIQPEGTFRGLVELRSPGWLRGETTAPFIQVTFGTVADEGIHGVGLACRMHLLTDPQCPDDALPVNGQDRRLPQYGGESAANYRKRLIDAWDAYALGGSHTAIEAGISAAGHGPTALLGDYGNPTVAYGDPTFFYRDLGAYVELRPTREGPRGEPAPYETQFWVVFGAGFHPITGGPKAWGSWTWGQTWLDTPGVWAPMGLTPDFYRTILSIVTKWKPSRYVFRGFTFVVNDVPYGDVTLTYGDQNIIYGGAIDLDVSLNTSQP